MRIAVTSGTLLLLSAIVLLSPAAPAAGAGKDNDAKKTSKVIARVNGEDVTKAEYDEMIQGNRRFFDLAKEPVRRMLEGKPWTEYVFEEEIVKVRAFAQSRAAELPALVEALEEARGRLARGEDFAAVARELSQDAVTAPNGGSLGDAKGFFDLVHPFNRVALSMKEGEISEPVLTIFGYHLIKVDRIIPAMEGKPKRVEVRHMLFPFAGDPRREADAALADAKVEILVKNPYCKKLPSYCPEPS